MVHAHACHKLRCRSCSHVWLLFLRKESKGQLMGLSAYLLASPRSLDRYRCRRGKCWAMRNWGAGEAQGTTKLEEGVGCGVQVRYLREAL